MNIKTQGSPKSLSEYVPIAYVGPMGSNLRTTGPGGIRSKLGTKQRSQTLIDEGMWRMVSHESYAVLLRAILKTSISSRFKMV